MVSQCGLPFTLLHTLRRITSAHRSITHAAVCQSNSSENFPIAFFSIVLQPAPYSLFCSFGCDHQPHSHWPSREPKNNNNCSMNVHCTRNVQNMVNQTTVWHFNQALCHSLRYECVGNVSNMNVQSQCSHSRNSQLLMTTCQRIQVWFMVIFPYLLSSVVREWMSWQVFYSSDSLVMHVNDNFTVSDDLPCHLTIARVRSHQHTTNLSMI